MLMFLQLDLFCPVRPKTLRYTNRGSKSFTFNLWTIYGELYSLTAKLMIYSFIASSLLPLSDQKRVKREPKKIQEPISLTPFTPSFFPIPAYFSPLGHSQWKELILSIHLPLLRQGWLAHSSVLMWQNTPSYPEIPDTQIVISKIVFLFLS